MIITDMNIIADINQNIPQAIITSVETKDNIPTVWINSAYLKDTLLYLKNKSMPSFSMLYDLSAIDERARRNKANQAETDFTIVYHLLSIDGNADIRLKVPLLGEYPSMESITDIWESANWYEREIWDMFGIKFISHPFMHRILMPEDWNGFPLRKEHPSRATELEGYSLPDAKLNDDEDEMKFKPEDYGLSTISDDSDHMFLNLGPHHPGTHGLLRAILQLEGELIIDSRLEIGFHHRGAEKMAERQTFHTYIPYTDRIDYLAGSQNNLPYCLSVEKLAGIDVPLKAQYIRVMLCELFRIASHLVWLGTYATDVGAMTPVFLTFTDRERLFDIIEAITGARMHPSWFRIGGVADELPNGWKEMVDDFLKYFPSKIEEYDKAIVQNHIFKLRTKGIGIYTKKSAIDWGVTGPNLRSVGINWDLRKIRPYSSYDHFVFEVPIADEGDCFARCIVRIEEMRQSLKIIKQAAENMPGGDYKSNHPLAMPPRKEHTMEDIETLINHFLSVSWGQPIPAGEAIISTEAPKGNYGYYLTSDGSNYAYRCRIRTPSFAHIQTLPALSRGVTISDFISILGSIDFVLGDVDR